MRKRHYNICEVEACAPNTLIDLDLIHNLDKKTIVACID